MIGRLHDVVSLHRAAAACGLVVAVIAVAFVTAGVNGSPKDSTRPSASPKIPAVIAVRIHADWCGACKKLTPVYSQLKERTNDQPVLFVTLDMTDDATRQQAEYLAGVLGLDRLWFKQARKTGSVVLLDGKRKRVVSTIEAPHDLKSMEAAVRKAIASSRKAS